MNLFVRFLITGGTGALLSLVTTWALTHYLVGEKHYFSAYLVGIGVNLLFNFVMYTLMVFKTQRDHIRRLLLFTFYGLLMAAFQGMSVRLITSIVGTAHYLIIIALVIGLFAILNFFVFKLSIFKEGGAGEGMGVRSALMFIILCAVIVRLTVLFNVLSVVGTDPLVYGDAVSYIELAQNIHSGVGFVSSRQTGIPVPEVFRTPGLPLLLSPFSETSTTLAWYFFILCIVSGLLLPYSTYLIGTRVLSTEGALIAAGITAFEPHLIFFSMLPQTEIPFMLFAYGGLAIVLTTHTKEKILLSLFSGVLLGYAILIRPGFLPVCLAAILMTMGYLWYTKMGLKQLIIILVGVLAAISPWMIRTHQLTGVYSLSGAGWRNVYTDYLASVRAIEHQTEFSDEKKNLKATAEEAGVPTEQVDNPAYGVKLRDYSLKELWVHKNTVVKLEPILLTSFFFQDGYYFQFQRFLLVPDDGDTSHISPTLTLLHKGLRGIPDVLQELSKQLFIPIIGRIFTIGTFLLACLGFFCTRGRLRYVFVIVIVLSAVTATAIGLGVEARLRLPVEPLLFIFVSAALVRFFPKRVTAYED